ncbi:hypothetical protein BZA77DRAFT_156239 [Pyronema omphalodes]|nr:hypothetical protein BZA77DRAFT_156239 [Pyronema omphalodes]
MRTMYVCTPVPVWMAASPPIMLSKALGCATGWCGDAQTKSPTCTTYEGGECTVPWYSSQKHSINYISFASLTPIDMNTISMNIVPAVHARLFSNSTGRSAQLRLWDFREADTPAALAAASAPSMIDEQRYVAVLAGTAYLQAVVFDRITKSAVGTISKCIPIMKLVTILVFDWIFCLAGRALIADNCGIYGTAISDESSSAVRF